MLVKLNPVLRFPFLGKLSLATCFERNTSLWKVLGETFFCVTICLFNRISETEACLSIVTRSTSYHHQVWCRCLPSTWTVVKNSCLKTDIWSFYPNIQSHDEVSFLTVFISLFKCVLYVLRTADDLIYRMKLTMTSENKMCVASWRWMMLKWFHVNSQVRLKPSSSMFYVSKIGFLRKLHSFVKFKLQFYVCWVNLVKFWNLITKVIANVVCGSYTHLFHDVTKRYVIVFFLVRENPNLIRILSLPLQQPPKKTRQTHLKVSLYLRQPGVTVL